MKFWNASLVSLAVERRTPKDEEQLELLQAEIEQATKSRDPFRFAAADVAFHSCFYSMARHRRLFSMWEQIAPSVRILLETTNYVDRDLRLASASTPRPPGGLHGQGFG